MKTFPESELILTKDRRLYHINLRAEDVADTVILVGDQNRVKEISNFFSKIFFKTSSREFITHTGIFNGKEITVISTGIGTDNMDIVLNELDAAVNIDLEKKELKNKKRKLNIIRLGTSGALQPEIKVNDLVVSQYVLGLDGLLNFYSGNEKVCDNSISDNFISYMKWNKNLPYPYCVAADKNLFKQFKSLGHTGITATAPGFYAPQGRELRLKSSIKNLNEKLSNYKFKGIRITNFEMETSALYGLGKMLGHHCLSICVIIANRTRKEFSSNMKTSTEILIESSLNKISDLK